MSRTLSPVLDNCNLGKKHRKPLSTRTAPHRTAGIGPQVSDRRPQSLVRTKTHRCGWSARHWPIPKRLYCIDFRRFSVIVSPQKFNSCKIILLTGKNLKVTWIVEFGFVLVFPSDVPLFYFERSRFVLEMAWIPPSPPSKLRTPPHHLLIEWKTWDRTSQPFIRFWKLQTPPHHVLIKKTRFWDTTFSGETHKQSVFSSSLSLAHATAPNRSLRSFRSPCPGWNQKFVLSSFQFFMFNWYFLDDCKTADDVVVTHAPLKFFVSNGQVGYFTGVVLPTEARTWFRGGRFALSTMHYNRHCSKAKEKLFAESYAWHF